MDDGAWVLIGMMGSGKSTVGRLLAERAGRDFRDSDQMIVHRLGRPIPQLFSIYGQEAFRDHETAILKSLERGPYVLATGGGIVVREENWTQMARLGLTIYLELSPELLTERLANSSRKRPLLQVENWEGKLRDILDERTPLYRRADVVVKLDEEDHSDAAEKVLEAIHSAQPN